MPHLVRDSFDRLLSAPDGGLPGIPGGGEPTRPSFEKPAPPTTPIAPPPAGAGGFPAPPIHGEPSGVPVQQGGTFELSGWWRRVGATLIDGLLVTIVFVPLLLIAFAIFGLSFDEDGNASGIGIAVSGFAFLMLILLWLVVSLVYAPYFMAKWDGATPGKKATGIRVVRADGQPMTFGTAALREVVIKQFLFNFVGQFTLGLATLVNVLWPLWDSENRALHDLIINTRVVRA